VVDRLGLVPIVHPLGYGAHSNPKLRAINNWRSESLDPATILLTTMPNIPPAATLTPHEPFTRADLPTNGEVVGFLPAACAHCLNGRFGVRPPNGAERPTIFSRRACQMPIVRSEPTRAVPD